MRSSPETSDAEIRRQLAEQVEREGRLVEVDLSAGGPPLILRFRDRLTPDAAARARRACFGAWREQGPGPKVLLLDERIEVFQLVGGEWRKLQ